MIFTISASSGLTISDCDAGKSGKNITGRPEFSQMLNDVAEDCDGVDFILVFKLSRFGRNAADLCVFCQHPECFQCIHDSQFLFNRAYGNMILVLLRLVVSNPNINAVFPFYLMKN